jgi:glycosyltransferase involved in cell wall biosynthesis
MKLALIVPGFSSSEQDWCIPAHTDIARALAAHHEVHVFTMRYPHRTDNYQLGNILVHSFNGVNSRGLTSARLWGRVINSIRSEHARGRFDILHAIFGSESGSVAVLAGKLLRVPSVVWLVNGELVGLPEINYGADLIPRQRQMNRLILDHADAILCGCDALTRVVRLRSPSQRVETLPLGVNTQRFHLDSSVTRTDDGPHLLNVGSLVPVKDQAALISAFQIVLKSYPNARLTIAGVGPLKNALCEQIERLGISARVSLVGAVPHDAMAPLYRSAHLYVQSSLHEGQGMALLEAAACGCALAGTNVGALADLATQSAAVPAPVHSPGALAHAMQAAFDDCQNLARRSGEILEREYTVDVTRARLEKTYRQLVDGKEIALEHTVARA